METKTLKIEIPNGYEIDKEKSTFENIVFKKVDEVIIKWDKCRNGVEIKADGEHFILDANPTYTMSWYDAMRFYKKLSFWKLPTINQLQVVYKYFNKINKVIKKNEGFVLIEGVYWSIKDRDEVCAWLVRMFDGTTVSTSKGNYYPVRAVSAL